jgi:hypothetical protein
MRNEPGSPSTAAGLFSFSIGKGLSMDTNDITADQAVDLIYRTDMSFCGAADKGGRREIALRFARWVVPGHGHGVSNDQMPRVAAFTRRSVRQAEKDSSTSQDQIRRYLRTWAEAAQRGHVPAADDLEPTTDVDWETSTLTEDEWRSCWHAAVTVAERKPKPPPTQPEPEQPASNTTEPSQSEQSVTEPEMPVGPSDESTRDVPVTEVRKPLTRHARYHDIRRLMRRGLSDKEIADDLDMNQRAVRHVSEQIIFEEMAIEEARANAPIVWDSLPGSMEAKLARIRTRIRNEVYASYEDDVVHEAQRRLELTLEGVIRHEKDAERVLAARKGVFTAAQYRDIRACLHPDSNMSEGRRSAAFRLFNEAAILLMDEKERPVVTSTLPSMEDLLKRRKRA